MFELWSTIILIVVATQLLRVRISYKQKEMSIKWRPTRFARRAWSRVQGLFNTEKKKGDVIEGEITDE